MCKSWPHSRTHAGDYFLTQRRLYKTRWAWQQSPPKLSTGKNESVTILNVDNEPTDGDSDGRLPRDRPPPVKKGAPESQIHNMTQIPKRRWHEHSASGRSVSGRHMETDRSKGCESPEEVLHKGYAFFCRATLLALVWTITGMLAA